MALLMRARSTHFLLNQSPAETEMAGRDAGMIVMILIDSTVMEGGENTMIVNGTATQKRKGRSIMSNTHRAIL